MQREITKLDIKDIRRPISSAFHAPGDNYIKQETFPKISSKTKIVGSEHFSSKDKSDDDEF